MWITGGSSGTPSRTARSTSPLRGLDLLVDEARERVADQRALAVRLLHAPTLTAL